MTVQFMINMSSKYIICELLPCGSQDAFRKSGILKLLNHTGVFPRKVTGSASGPIAKEKVHKA